FVEADDHAADLVPQVHLAVLEQHAFPQRVVQVPHQALDRAHAVAPQTSQSVTAQAATGLLLRTSTWSPSDTSPLSRSRWGLRPPPMARRWPYSASCRRHRGWIGRPSSVS